ncbi:MAG TPA: carboxypeptidase-like regulatory domain-containing protein [Candidatus Angelobacter sp.]
MTHHLVLLVLALGNLLVTGSSKSLMHGRVADPLEAVIADARIEITADSNGSKPPDTGAQAFKTAIFTDSYGNFSTEVRPGAYNVCVSHNGFYTSCRKIKIEERMEAILDFSLEPGNDADRAGDEVMDQRLQILAGANAKDCGRVKEKADPRSATACVLRAFRRSQPFRVRYDSWGDVSMGLVSDSHGKLYGVYFCSKPIPSSSLTPDATMEDGSHSMVLSCPKPARITVSRRGKAICFRESQEWSWIFGE